MKGDEAPLDSDTSSGVETSGTTSLKITRPWRWQASPPVPFSPQADKSKLRQHPDTEKRGQPLITTNESEANTPPKARTPPSTVSPQVAVGEDRKTSPVPRRRSSNKRRKSSSPHSDEQNGRKSTKGKATSGDVHKAFPSVEHPTNAVAPQPGQSTEAARALGPRKSVVSTALNKKRCLKNTPHVSVYCPSTELEAIDTVHDTLFRSRTTGCEPRAPGFTQNPLKGGGMPQKPSSSDGRRCKPHDPDTASVTTGAGTFTAPFGEQTLERAGGTLREKSSSRHRKLVVPCVTTALAAGIILLLVLLSLTLCAPAIAAPDIVENDASLVCYSIACRGVVGLLAQTADSDVQPCDDFYRYVCGGWPGRVPGRTNADISGSYARANLRSFITRVHRSLQGASQRPGLCGTSDCRIERFYASCLQFAHNSTLGPQRPSLRVLLEQAGIDGYAWGRADTLPSLLDNDMRSCLGTGLCSVLSARLSASRDVYIDLGESLRLALDEAAGDLQRVRRLLNDTLAEVHPPASKESYEAILAVDSQVEDIRKSADPLVDRFRVVSLADLPHPLPELSALSEALRDRPHERGRSPSHGADKNGRPRLQARTLDKVAAVVNVLASVDVSIAGLYLLLVTSSHLLKYSYILRQPDGDDHIQAAMVCLRATATHFAQQFPSWLARMTEAPDARPYLHTMVSDLNTCSMAQNDAQNDAYPAIVLRTSNLPLQTVFALALRCALCFPHREPASLAATDVPQAREEVPALDDEDFLPSVIQRSKALLPEDWPSVQRRLQQQLRGGTAEDDGVVTVPSLPHGRPATPRGLGRDPRLLDRRKVLKPPIQIQPTLRLPRRGHVNVTSVSAYSKCVEEHATSALGGSWSKGALRFVPFLPWALDVALMAATRGGTRHGDAESGVSVQRALKRVFFRRFCLTTCGDPEAAATCRYAVLHSLHFAHAFGCTRPPLHVPC
ncbi:hypothetical protein HPB48_014785 [Haemaphysalis longicornis]|uniref:Peptidase M13 N-terminal domain-containing protein n=1 Tax=Haemaphysalis longicornis TaxID=44386 RepID=A0A9J6GDX4_HAELO|nr:hypothetical protein HPB48_014785 [Haemaphysalis longicornis]